MINTSVTTKTNVTRASPCVIMYALTLWGRTCARVDQATESLMSPIVRTLMNVSIPTTACKHASTLLAVTHVQFKKIILAFHLVSELNIFIDIFKANKGVK